MRVLNTDDERKKVIVLQDEEEIEVKTLKGNPIRIQIMCKDGVLLIDDISEKRIKEIKTEQEQLKKMNKIK